MKEVFFSKPPYNMPDIQILQKFLIILMINCLQIFAPALNCSGIFIICPEKVGLQGIPKERVEVGILFMNEML